MKSAPLSMGACASLSLFLPLFIASRFGLLAAQENETKFFDSPDGRFSLKVSLPKTEAEEAKLEVVEKASGNVVSDLRLDHVRTSKSLGRATRSASPMALLA